MSRVVRQTGGRWVHTDGAGAENRNLSFLENIARHGEERGEGDGRWRGGAGWVEEWGEEKREAGLAEG